MSTLFPNPPMSWLLDACVRPHVRVVFACFTYKYGMCRDGEGGRDRVAVGAKHVIRRANRLPRDRLYGCFLELHHNAGISPLVVD